METVTTRQTRSLAAWIQASRDFDLEDEGVLSWYINARYRGVALDCKRSPRSNLLSYNVTVVRDLPHSNR